jgi:hypothetical protein
MAGAFSSTRPAGRPARFQEIEIDLAQARREVDRAG